MKAPPTITPLLVALLLSAGCATDPMAGVAFDFNQPPPDPKTEPFLVTLSPADYDRAGEVVTFPLPAGWSKMRDPWLWDAWRGKTIVPLQVDEHGQATAMIGFQKAGETLVFAFRNAPKFSPMNVAANVDGEKRHAILVPTAEARSATVTPEDGRLRFAVNNQPVFYYQMALAQPPREGIDQKIWRGAFLYPIYTPKGVQVSDSYPVDHPHDHGIWTAWASSMFQGRHVDFWNPHYQAPRQAAGGTVEFVTLDRTWSGVVDAGFEARHRSVDRSVTPNVAALDEKWKVTLYAAAGVPARVFDLEFTQTPAGNDPLEVLKYTYGGLGVRGHVQWEDKNNCWVLNSEGTTDRVQANNQAARWFFLGGNIDGAPAGIGVLGHPANFRAPQTVRANPDGPFFMYAPNINAGFTITKEQPYLAHYRFIVQDGPPDAKFLEACWQGFAHPATATVTAR